jgi:hypothetical protein
MGNNREIADVGDGGRAHGAQITSGQECGK